MDLSVSHSTLSSHSDGPGFTTVSPIITDLTVPQLVLSPHSNRPACTTVSLITTQQQTGLYQSQSYHHTATDRPYHITTQQQTGLTTANLITTPPRTLSLFARPKSPEQQYDHDHVQNSLSPVRSGFQLWVVVVGGGGGDGGGGRIRVGI